MTYHGIDIQKNQIDEFCRRNHIRKLALFGSILRDDFKPNSDVDILVEFAEGFTPSLLQMVRLESELSALLGRKADLRTPSELSPYFRKEVIQHSEVQYVQG